MKKNRWLAGVLLVLFVIGLTIGIWQYYSRPGKVNFDKVGGTALVYEIVPPKDGEADADLATNLAKVLEKRLDPDGRGFASVRPLDKNQVEIRIAKVGNAHADDVARAKESLTKVGELEFRILANNIDDAMGIKDAKDMLNTHVETDKGLQATLKNFQEHGLPPPGPRAAGALEQTVYEIVLHKDKSLVTYGWVELGPQERRLLNLDAAAEFDPERKHVWLEANHMRGKATTLKDPSSTTGRLLLNGALFYSRACEDRNLSPEERKKKGVDYFVLARDPELDPKVPDKESLEKRRTARIDGSKIGGAKSTLGFDKRPAVEFKFTEEGGHLFGNLTRKNIPSGDPEEGQLKRHLGIILDGRLVSAPTINSEIRKQGMISGIFTQNEADAFANILQAGILPARLKPLPVSETPVPAKAGK